MRIVTCTDCGKRNKKNIEAGNGMIEKEAMYKIPYGLFMVSTPNGAKQNGCIVNTVSMITDNPKRITVYLNKSNYTEELIKAHGIFNVSILTEKTPFEIFKQFGFQSGRDVDKFAGTDYPKTENGLYYLPNYANAVLSARVIDFHEYGTHTLFVAEVTEAKALSSEASVTYGYYLENIKPKVQKSATEKWVCKICGYTHEGELPQDFICPWCKHPAEDFEKV